MILDTFCKGVKSVLYHKHTTKLFHVNFWDICKTQLLYVRTNTKTPVAVNFMQWMSLKSTIRYTYLHCNFRIRENVCIHHVLNSVSFITILHQKPHINEAYVVIIALRACVWCVRANVYLACARLLNSFVETSRVHHTQEYIWVWVVCFWVCLFCINLPVVEQWTILLSIFGSV